MLVACSEARRLRHPLLLCEERERAIKRYFLRTFELLDS